MLSQTAEYALRAVLLLSRQAGKGPKRVDDVAEMLGVPRNYLSKVLHALARAKVLTSARGPRGGFELAVPAGELTLARIIGEFDDLESRSSCLLGRAECSDDNACVVHDRWKSVRSAMLAFFRETTVADLGHEPGVDALDIHTTGEP